MAGKELGIVLKSTFSQVTDQMKKLSDQMKVLEKNSVTTIKTIEKAGNIEGFTRITKSLDGSLVGVQKLDKNMNILSTTMKETSKTGMSLKSALSNMYDLNKLYLYWNLTKRIRDTIKNVLASSIDYIETQNKFNMSMGSAKNDAVKFVNQINEAVGIGKQVLMDYQSTFKNILSGLGTFTDQQSEKISESLTKMALDYSSLFNVDQDKSMEKFQAALVGSIRPIRSDSGYDVSDTTIGAKAQELGLDRSVNQLNQMEKRILRIIVLMDQMRNTGAMGDLARTIEQPANQIKILKQQVQELGVWIGNVFMGTIGKILPYVNAFVMVLKELTKMFAVFVGYKGDNSSLSDVFEVSESASGGIASNLDKAEKSAKEIKKQLMGFDVLNVISTPSDSKSGGSGAGGGLSVDPKILNALKEYDSLMEKVKMKATAIRDKIMDWLGFIKKINPLTGELEWQLRDGYTNFEKILDVVKAIGVALLTWKVSSKVANLLSTIFGWRGLHKKAAMSIAAGITLAITGAFVEYNGISHLVDDGMDIFAVLETIAGFGMNGFGFFTILKALNKVGVIKLTTGKMIGISAGLALIVSGIEVGMKAVETSNKLLMALSSTLTGVGAGITVGLMTGNLIIGIVASVVVSIGSFVFENLELGAKATKELKKESKELSKELDNVIASSNSASSSIKDTAVSELAQLEYTERLKNKLSALVDENGKVKEGYEKRAEYILGQLNKALGTEYEMNGNIITNYQDMRKEISDLIKQKKKEIELNAYEELYKDSIEQNIKLKQEQKKLQKEQNDLLEEHHRIVTEEPYNIVAMHEWNVAWETNNKSIQKCTDSLNENNIEMNFYGDKIEELSTDAVEATGEITTNVSDMVSTTVDNMSELKDEVANDFKNMEENSQDYSSEFGKMKDEIHDDVTNGQDGLIKTWQDAGTEMKNMSTSAQTETGNIKNSFNSLDSIRTALDGPLGALLTALNPGLGIGLQLVNAAANLASKMSEKLHINANFSISGGGGSGGGRIGARASGGPVNVGEMFIAREAGPELVGSIGNTTSVMNNQQIVEAVSTGVANAVSRVMGNGRGDVKLIVDSREIATVVENRLNRRNAMYGV